MKKIDIAGKSLGKLRIKQSVCCYASLKVKSFSIFSHQMNFFMQKWLTAGKINKFYA